MNYQNIIDFLKQNPEKWFTVLEIYAATKMSASNTYSGLWNLKSSGKVLFELSHGNYGILRAKFLSD